MHFPASSFRVPPKAIGIIICGGGGGACGMGRSAGDKSGFNRAPSAGGGGGAIVGAILKKEGERYLIRIGAGGAGGLGISFGEEVKSEIDSLEAEEKEINDSIQAEEEKQEIWRILTKYGERDNPQNRKKSGFGIKTNKSKKNR